MTPRENECLWELLRLDVPKTLLLALKEPKETKAIKAARAYCGDEKARWLALLGSVGAGKSVAAAEVCRWWLMGCGWNNLSTGQVPHLAWVEARTLTGLSAYAPHDLARLWELERIPLVVVDDMGDEGTETGRAHLVGLLSARHAKRRRTVITSNLKLDAFAKRYGSALVDRIRELSHIPAIQSEPSMRVRPGAA